MSLVKKSIGLMLVFFFTICFVPAFAAGPKDSKCPGCSNCSKTPECYMLQRARLNVVARDFHKLLYQTPYIDDTLYPLRHAIMVLEELSLPKKWESFLHTMIKNCKNAEFEVCHGSWDQALILIKQTCDDLDAICIDLMGFKVEYR